MYSNTGVLLRTLPTHTTSEAEAAHPEGLTAEQLRGSLTPSTPLGDTLQGMKKTGAVTTQGQGRAVRYFAAQG